MTTSSHHLTCIFWLFPQFPKDQHSTKTFPNSPHLLPICRNLAQVPFCQKSVDSTSHLFASEFHKIFCSCCFFWCQLDVSRLPTWWDLLKSPIQPMHFFATNLILMDENILALWYWNTALDDDALTKVGQKSRFDAQEMFHWSPPESVQTERSRSKLPKF